MGTTPNTHFPHLTKVPVNDRMCMYVYVCTMHVCMYVYVAPSVRFKSRFEHS